MKISDNGFLVPESMKHQAIGRIKRGLDYSGNRILQAQQCGAHIITLPNGNKVRIRDYCAGWKRLLSAIENEDPEGVQFSGFADGSMSPHQILKSISAGVHDRINQFVFHYNNGRKWASEYYWSCKRDQRLIHDHFTQRRIIYRFETAEAQRRFGHLVTTPEEI